MIRVNKIAKERYNLLNNSKKDFRAIFDVMFRDEANTLAEKNDGFRIYKVSYKETKNLILAKAYSLNKLYPNLKHEFIGISIDSSIEWIIAFWAIIVSNNKPYDGIYKTCFVSWYLTVLKDVNLLSSSLGLIILYQFSSTPYIFSNVMISFRCNASLGITKFTSIFNLK